MGIFFFQKFFYDDDDREVDVYFLGYLDIFFPSYFILYVFVQTICSFWYNVDDLFLSLFLNIRIETFCFFSLSILYFDII